MITIRKLQYEDASMIEKAFHEQEWYGKTKQQYQNYYEEQLDVKREVLLAFYDNEFAGYVTIVWDSTYKYFRNKNIPEIVDLNTLIKFRRKGVATDLLDVAENLIKSKSKYAGIGVGMTKDYGNAQIMYVNRGYIPDGNGLVYKGNMTSYGDKIEVNDDLVLYSLKLLV